MFHFVKRLVPFSTTLTSARPARGSARHDRRARPSLEALEERTVPTTLFSPRFGAETIY